MQEPYLTVFQCFNSLTLGIFVCDPDGLTIRFANGCAEQWFGPGLLGRPLASVAPSLKEATVAKHLAKGREFTLTGEIAPPSGRRVAFRLSIAPKPLGPEQFLVAQVEDISRWSRSFFLTPTPAWLSARRGKPRRNGSEPR